MALYRQTQRTVLGSTRIVEALEGCIVDVRDSGCNEQGGGVLSFSVSLPSFAPIIMSFTFW